MASMNQVARRLPPGSTAELSSRALEVAQTRYVRLAGQRDSFGGLGPFSSGSSGSPYLGLVPELETLGDGDAGFDSWLMILTWALRRPYRR